MTPDLFRLWARGAWERGDVAAVLQVCHERGFTDDPVVRALAELLDCAQQAINKANEEAESRLNDVHTVGVCRMASEAKDYLNDLPRDTPISDLDGVIDGLADQLCAEEWPSDELRLEALHTEGIRRPTAVRKAGALRGDLQIVLAVLSESPEGMKKADVVKAVNLRLGKDGSNAAYNMIKALRSKGLIEEFGSRMLRIKRKS